MMRRIILLTCLSLASVGIAIPVCPEKSIPVEFVILIASYNNEKYAIDNLESACFQKSTHPYHIYYVNDCSTDRTAEIVESFVREHQLESLVTVINNRKNVGPLENYYNVIHKLIPDHKIVVNLDGDDMLAHDNVLLALEKYYSDPEVWMTYGSCLEYPAMKKSWWIRPIPKKVMRKRTFRKFGLVTHHLRTFKASLFKKIRKEDLMHNGSFIRFGGDNAFMFPLVEMCTGIEVNHARSIPEILYYWRVNNPLNDFRANAEEQRKMGLLVLAMKPYAPIPSLDYCIDWENHL